MRSMEKDGRTDFDMIIVGAGISGVNTAYRIQTELPKYDYIILESRGASGGTWDLFRYPGIRSDSDLHTFGFSWRPWSGQKAIADGEFIRSYIQESAEEYGIDKKIRFHHRLLAADWSSDNQRWALEVLDSEGKKKTFTARFVVFGTGYYDYNQPLQTHIPGIDNFEGQIIHPQFWPEDLEYTGKKIIIIGSGATAITLLPNIAESAAKVTMLQRSPGYVVAVPSVDSTGAWMRRWLPTWLAYKLVRWRFLVLPFLFFLFCRKFPNAARRLIEWETTKQLPDNIPHDPNFNPRYGPWDQRLCVCPDGDFFEALKHGKADVVTDTIKTVTGDGILTETGKKLAADIIITATGLKMQLVGGASVSVDGVHVDLSKKFAWKSAMLQDIPNAALMIGYTNASWTLGADTTAHLVCRLCQYMDGKHMGSATPRVKEGINMTASNFLNLNSTYIEKAKGDLPSAGDRAPWKARSNYFVDSWTASHDLTTDLQFEKIGTR